MLLCITSHNIKLHKQFELKFKMFKLFTFQFVCIDTVRFEHGFNSRYIDTIYIT